MGMVETIPLLGPGDYAGLAVLLISWLAITWWIERETSAKPSVTVLMGRYRRDWMQEMVTREARNFDATILSNLRQGTAFFASGSLIALGGVLALAGNAEQLSSLVDEFDFVSQHAELWQLKLVAGALLLTHGFLKFVWSNRLFGYCAVIMAACPNDVEDPHVTIRARQAAEINIRAALNLNRGLRSVYYALTVLAWLLGWATFLVAVLAVTYVMWSREFASASRDILLDDS